MLDKLFFISLVLSLTGLFRFLAPQLGTSIGQVSLALLVFNLFYLVSRFSYLQALGQRIIPWLVLLVTWPLATLIYAPAIEARQIGLLVNGAALFAGTAAYTMSKGPLAIRRVFWVALVVTYFGVVLNMAVPGYFENVALLADARVTSLNRPGGFFMQPNSLAIGITYMFIGWLAFARRNTVYFEPAAVLVFLGFLLLTGSRSGIIIGLLVAAFHFGFQWRSTLFRSQRVRGFSIRLAIFGTFGFFGLVGMKLFIEMYRPTVEVASGGLIDRIFNMLEFRLVDENINIAQDKSVLARSEIQNLYLQLINERPILGHGFGAEAEFLEAGILFRTAHSTILTAAMEYGIFFPLFALLLLLLLFVNKNRPNLEKMLGTNAIVQFLAITSLLFVYSGGLLSDRVFLIVLGVLFVVSRAPSYIFRRPAVKPVKRSHTIPISTKHPVR
jgi:O-antigen ligase